jgi:hypothetical protein
MPVQLHGWYMGRKINIIKNLKSIKKHREISLQRTAKDFSSYTPVSIITINLLFNSNLNNQ